MHQILYFQLSRGMGRKYTLLTVWPDLEQLWQNLSLFLRVYLVFTIILNLLRQFYHLATFHSFQMTKSWTNSPDIWSQFLLVTNLYKIFIRLSQNIISYSNCHFPLFLRIQCDQIGWFLKVLGDKICSKSSPNDWQHFGQCWKTLLSCSKLLLLLFGQLVETFVATFSTTSGHTVHITPHSRTF